MACLPGIPSRQADTPYARRQRPPLFLATSTMLLLDTMTHERSDFADTDHPPFAVLSYIWNNGDILSQADLVPDRKHPLIHPNILRACEKAITMGIGYLWVGSLCIAAATSSLLATPNHQTFNDSYRWLQMSTVCITFLDDLRPDGPRFDENIWSQCRYWTRAWTLQELIGPRRVEFYDADWQYRGSKTSPELLPILSGITHIPKSVLLDSEALSRVSLAVRMSWAANRKACLGEDTAYSMAGIVGVAIPVRYGEGSEQAFLRLVKEILFHSRDGSIHAWRRVGTGGQQIRGLLARSPSEFGHFISTSNVRPWIFDGKLRFGGKDIQIESCGYKSGPCVVLEIGRSEQDLHVLQRFGICFRESNGTYVRVNPSSVVNFTVGTAYSIHVTPDVDAAMSSEISAAFLAADQETDLTTSRTPPSTSGSDTASDDQQPANCHFALTRHLDLARKVLRETSHPT